MWGCGRMQLGSLMFANNCPEQIQRSVLITRKSRHYRLPLSEKEDIPLDLRGGRQVFVEIHFAPLSAFSVKLTESDGLTVQHLEERMNRMVL
ncbi:unnamed protein product [Protopolystoma xenopodis]|uniref:Uncharacterized protein n=1 Tax=Protopolystoma xenopodis TaxID=117903 RepID=A0A448XD14_9PLAT|nr:unnamed protein product [Protopolystoma xenopodis]